MSMTSLAHSSLMNNDTAMIEEHDDSPWSMEEEDEQSHHIADQEWNKLSSRYTDAGYRDGITSGKASTLQTGFDQGFTLATPFARRVGYLRGITSSLLTLFTAPAGMKYFSEEMRGKLQGSPGGGGVEGVVSECRLIMTELGKCKESNVVPVDLEAVEHARSHGNESIESEKRSLERLNDAFAGLGSSHTSAGMMKESGGEESLDECAERIQRVLNEMGIEGVNVRRI